MLWGEPDKNTDVLVLLVYYVNDILQSVAWPVFILSSVWFYDTFTYYVLLTTGFSLAARRQFLCVGILVAFKSVRGTICYENLS